MLIIKPNRILIIVLVFALSVCLNANAKDFITFGEGQQPYSGNADYEITIKSILNTKDFVFINATVKAKRRFRFPQCYDFKKSDRIDFLSKDSLKLIEKDSVGEYSELPYIDLSTIESCHNGQPVTVLYNRDKSMNLDKNEIKDFTLVFKGHISSSARTLSLLQNNEERYFSFTDIPVAFDYHSDWELKYKNEQEIIDAIDKSNVPICGIYENNNGLRFACLKEGSKYNLICLDTSNDYKWSFGDIKGYFSETLNPLVFKGYKYGNRFKSQYNSN